MSELSGQLSHEKEPAPEKEAAVLVGEESTPAPVKVESKAEVKAETKTEVKPVVKVEVKVEMKTETKTATKVETKTETKSSTKSEAKPEIKIETSTVTTSDSDSEKKPTTLQQDLINADMAMLYESLISRNDGLYHLLLTDVNKLMDRMAIDFPDNVKVNSIGKSFQGRDINYVSIEIPSEVSNKPAILLTGATHARELISTSLNVY